MKRVFFSFLSALMLFAVQQVDAVKYVDAQSLTFLGKMCETTNPYHRVEVDDYPSLNNTEKTQLNASNIFVLPVPLLPIITCVSLAESKFKFKPLRFLNSDVIFSVNSFILRENHIIEIFYVFLH